MSWKDMIPNPVRRRISTSRIWRRNRSAPMTAARANSLIDAVEAEGVALWVGGGWGVDALLGEETRVHEDLDIIVALADAPAVEGVLRARGYRRVSGDDDPAAWFGVADRRGHLVEIHPVAFDRSGRGTYPLQPGIQWTYPASGFGGTGRIAAREVRCLTPEAQIAAHDPQLYAEVGHVYIPKQSHVEGMRALGQRFGIDVPAALDAAPLGTDARGR